MTKKRPSITLEGAKGSVTIRAYGKGFRIKATMNDGDVAAEMALAAHAVSLLQAILRAETNMPDLQFKVGAIRHIDDHERTA